jgi:hypothetical protein
MAFAYTNSKGTTYYLHGREVALNNDHQRTIYFFAKDAREGALDQVPEGWQVMEGRNALPVLSKENGKNGDRKSPKSGRSSKHGNNGNTTRGSGAGGRGGGTGSSERSRDNKS